MKTKHRIFWWIDIVLFTGFLVAFFMSFTGIELHQGIGIMGGLLTAYHLLIHWEWVDAVAKRLSARTGTSIWLKFITDGVILAGFALIIFTGLVISTWLDFPVSDFNGWLTFHILASIVTLLALMVKLALHWRWISKSARELVNPPTFTAAKTLVLLHEPLEKRAMDRRDFIKVMGVTGGASLLALLSATRSLAYLQGENSNMASLSGSGETSSTASNSSEYPNSSSYAPSSGSCYIQCGRRCSFPGHCRRYTDADHDNYCDLGQCA